MPLDLNDGHFRTWRTCSNVLIGVMINVMREDRIEMFGTYRL